MTARTVSFATNDTKDSYENTPETAPLTRSLSVAPPVDIHKKRARDTEETEDEAPEENQCASPVSKLKPRSLSFDNVEKEDNCTGQPATDSQPSVVAPGDLEEGEILPTAACDFRDAV
jgi:hypothetical protein